MLSPEQHQKALVRIRLGQFVAALMLVASIAMLALVGFVFVDLDNMEPATKMLTLFGACAGFFLFLIGWIFPKLFTTDAAVRGSDRDAAEKSAIAEILNAIITEIIARHALIEAGIFLNVVVLMLEPQRTTLVMIAIGILLAILIFPRKSSLLRTITERFDRFQKRFVAADPSNSAG